MGLMSPPLFTGYDLVRYVMNLSQVDGCMAWLHIKSEGLSLPLPLAARDKSFSQLVDECAEGDVLLDSESFKVTIGFQSPNVSMLRKSQLAELVARLLLQDYAERGLNQEVLPFYSPARIASDKLQSFASNLIISNLGVLVGRRGEDQQEYLNYLFKLLGVPSSEYSAWHDRSDAMLLEGESAPVVFVPELALLEEDDQLYLAKKIELGMSCVAQTAYQLEPLSSEGLLLPSLYERLHENQLTFSVSLFSPSARKLDDGSSKPKDSSRVLDIGAALEGGLKIRDIVREMEVRAIKAAYSIGGGSQMKVASMLGISRGSLQHKFKKYELPYGDWK